MFWPHLEWLCLYIASLKKPQSAKKQYTMRKLHGTWAKLANNTKIGISGIEQVQVSWNFYLSWWHILIRTSVPITILGHRLLFVMTFKTEYQRSQSLQTAILWLQKSVGFYLWKADGRTKYWRDIFCSQIWPGHALARVEYLVLSHVEWL